MTDDAGNSANAGHAGAALHKNADAREALQWIVATYGTTVAADLKRVEWLLGDLCRTRQRENRLLINAAREGVPAELLSPKASLLPAELLLSRLSRYLEENLLVTHHVARWAVESWALALGRITADELTTQQLHAPQAPKRVDPVPPDPVIGDESEKAIPAPVVDPPIIDSGNVPDSYRGWNWSAFFLGWVWLFGHKLWRWGIVSFLACFLICVLSQWYVPFMQQHSALYQWERDMGTALTSKTNAHLRTEFEPETFGIPIVEYAFVLLTFLPIGMFGNRLVSHRTASRNFAGETRIERRWKLWGCAALILGPLLFRVENPAMGWLIEALFPT